MGSAHDVARELKRRLPDSGDREIHVLAYYCQAWHATWVGDAMFDAGIEAGPDGPIVTGLGTVDAGAGEGALLGDRHVAVVDYVLGRYGHQAGEDLLALARSEDPWQDASPREGPLGQSAEIITEAMVAWCSQDEEYVGHQAELARLRKRRDVYGLQAPPFPEPLHEAALRLTGPA